MTRDAAVHDCALPQIQLEKASLLRLTRRYFDGLGSRRLPMPCLHTCAQQGVQHSKQHNITHGATLVLTFPGRKILPAQNQLLHTSLYIPSHRAQVFI